MTGSPVQEQRVEAGHTSSDTVRDAVGRTARVGPSILVVVTLRPVVRVAGPTAKATRVGGLATAATVRPSRNGADASTTDLGIGTAARLSLDGAASGVVAFACTASGPAVVAASGVTVGHLLCRGSTSPRRWVV